MKQLQVVFVSKPFDLKELLYWQGALIRPECVEIAEIIRLSPGAYDELVSYFTRRRAWLRGKGGRNGCLLVQAPGRRSLVIDPQGYDYARYVALA